jgi:hypothetical protein
MNSTKQDATAQSLPVRETPSDFSVYDEKFEQRFIWQKNRLDWLDALVKAKMAEPDNAGTPVELSFEELFFFSRDHEQAILQTGYHLYGELNVDALHRSFKEIVGRHETLCTIYRKDGPGIVRDIQSAMSFSIRLIKSHDAADQKGIIKEQLSLEAERIALMEKPQFAVALISFSETHHVLLISVFHTIFDGMSYSLLNNELSQLYEAFNAGRVSPLAPLKSQYSDYVKWQKNWISSAEFKNKSDYWLSRLKDAPSLLELPTDKNRAVVKSCAFANIIIPKSTTAQLFNISEQMGITRFTALLAIMNITLGCYCNIPDTVIAYSNAGRFTPGLNEMIANFYNALLFRFKFNSELSFKEITSDIANKSFKDLINFQMPLLVLKEMLSKQQNRDYKNLLQVQISLKPEISKLKLVAIDVQEIPNHEIYLMRDWFFEKKPNALGGEELGIIEMDGTLIFYYNKEMHCGSAMHLLVEKMCTLVEAVAKSPLIPISKLEM